jgi:NOL1/NOP2/sun family putative RNA methylase
MNILRRYKELGQDFSPSSIKIAQTLRVNTLKIKNDELVKRMKSKEVTLQKIPYLENGYSYYAAFSLGSTQEYLQGFYYLQESASQLPVQVLDPKPGEKVLDMAASPGSKTTQIAQLMNNSGLIVALENDAGRLDRLKNNIERMGVKNTIVYKKDARFSDDLDIKFDKILLDAPCSGNFCVELDFFKKRTIQDFQNKAKVQKELLRSASRSLKKGGVLVYSTCSLEPEENELVIDEFLSLNKDMMLVDTKLSVGEPGLTEIFGNKINQNINLTRRFWPHKTGMEGFFIAKMVKQ